MKSLKILVFIFFISALFFSCTAISVKDIKEMEPFLKTKTAKLDKKIEIEKHSYLTKENH